MSFLRFAALLAALLAAVPAFATNAPRAVYDDVAGITGVDLNPPGSGTTPPTYITITCYYTSSTIPCAGGGDFDLGASGCASNGGTIIHDMHSTPNCYYRKNFGLNGVVDARQCGVYGTGDFTAQDAKALQACLELAKANKIPIVNTGGGRVRDDQFILGGSYGQNIVIPGGVTLDCGGGSALGQVQNNDYSDDLTPSDRRVQHAIILAGARTIRPKNLVLDTGTDDGAGAGITGCVIMRADEGGADPYAPSHRVPTTLRQALTARAAFGSGTAIMAISESFSVTNTLILGFGTCWTNNAGTTTPADQKTGRRVILDHVNCDGTTGFAINSGGGGTQFDDLNVRSFLTGTGFVDCDCNEYTWENEGSTANFVRLARNTANNKYQVLLDTSVGGSPPQDGDTVWVRTPTDHLQSAGGRYENITGVTSITTSPCPTSSCVYFDLPGSVFSSSNPLYQRADTATFASGTNMLTGLSIDLNTLAIGMNVGSPSGGCIPSGTIADIEPAWNTVCISSNTPTTCASTTDNHVLFWDSDDTYPTSASSGQLTLSAQTRSGDAFSILGAPGVTFNNCHSSNHYTGFHAGEGSGQTRFVNCVNENDHDLEDDALYGLVCEVDCGGADWVNGILGQHATVAIKVDTSSHKVVHVTNAGVGPSSGRQRGRYADLIRGNLILDSAAADSAGNIFVWRSDEDHEAHLTMDGAYAPNGMIYQQDATAIANTTGCGNTFSVPTPYSCTPAFAVPLPGGRLSLTAYSATPPTGAVITSDVTNGSKIYYVPYNSQALPIWNGSAYGAVDIGSTGLSMNLNSGVQMHQTLYDIFAETSRAGVPELCTGPAWTMTPSIARSSTIAKNQGLWGNSGQMTCTHAATAFSCPAYACTYLGTTYPLTDGRATMQIGPKSQVNGPALCVCLYNAYNRVPVVAEGHDTVGSYTDSTSGWHPMNGSTTHDGGLADGMTAKDSITVVDGLGEMNVEAELFDITKGSAGVPAQIGIDFNAVTGAPLYASVNPSTVNAFSFGASLRAPPLPGLWFVQAMELGGGTASSPSYGSAGYQVFSISVDD